MWKQDIEFVFDNFRYRVGPNGTLAHQKEHTTYKNAWIDNSNTMDSLARAAINDSRMQSFIKAYEDACGPPHPVEVF